MIWLSVGPRARGVEAWLRGARMMDTRASQLVVQFAQAPNTLAQQMPPPPVEASTMHNEARARARGSHDPRGRISTPPPQWNARAPTQNEKPFVSLII